MLCLGLGASGATPPERSPRSEASRWKTHGNTRQLFLWYPQKWVPPEVPGLWGWSPKGRSAPTYTAGPASYTTATQGIPAPAFGPRAGPLADAAMPGPPGETSQPRPGCNGPPLGDIIYIYVYKDISYIYIQYIHIYYFGAPSCRRHVGAHSWQGGYRPPATHLMGLRRSFGAMIGVR